ncbi:MAG: STELLO glycosyltransferase family protein [bacterium]|nr:STELLO glycosyltransferase family protein [bacterium]
MKKFIVITSINDRTKAVKAFEKIPDWHVVLVGDKKTPQIKSSKNLTFLSVQDQKKLGYEFVRYSPYNHYTRKNIGYIYAMRQGADIIYDTDDDNLPYKHWKCPDFTSKRSIETKDKYYNVYNYFSKKLIWPRGYPLDLIQTKNKSKLKQHSKLTSIGAWQGLADTDPDVDAIYRLVFNDTTKFDRKKSIHLPKKCYCPFNSQNTFWQKKAFPLLYLPATVSFRFTDILRGYLAQHIMWLHGMHLGFTEATVYQERNAHNLMKDFADEVEVYQNTKPIIELLQNIKLGKDLLKNLEIVYTALHKNGFVSNDEIKLVRAWLTDIK